MATPDELRQRQLEEAARRQQLLQPTIPPVLPQRRPMEAEVRPGVDDFGFMDYSDTGMVRPEPDPYGPGRGRLGLEGPRQPWMNAYREGKRLDKEYKPGPRGIRNIHGEELPEVVRMREFYKDAYAPGKPNAEVWVDRIMSEEGLPRAAAEMRYEQTLEGIHEGIDQPVYGATERGDVSHYIAPWHKKRWVKQFWPERTKGETAGIHLTPSGYGPPDPPFYMEKKGVGHSPPKTRGDVIRHEGAHAISAWAPKYKGMGAGYEPGSMGWMAGITPTAATDEWNLKRIDAVFPAAYGQSWLDQVRPPRNYQHSRYPEEIYANIIYTRAHLGRLLTAQDIAEMRAGTWNKSPYQASGDLVQALQRGISTLSDEEIANTLNQVSEADTRQPTNQMGA